MAPSAYTSELLVARPGSRACSGAMYPGVPRNDAPRCIGVMRGRVAAAGPSTTADGEMSPAYVGALLEQTAETLDRLSHTLEKHTRDLDSTLRRVAEEGASGQQEAARALREEIRGRRESLGQGR